MALAFEANIFQDPHWDLMINNPHNTVSTYDSLKDNMPKILISYASEIIATSGLYAIYKSLFLVFCPTTFFSLLSSYCECNDNILIPYSVIFFCILISYSFFCWLHLDLEKI